MDETEAEDESGAEEAAPIDFDKIAKKMHHSLRQLHSAAKRSKQFEIQRLVKRIKGGGPSSKAEAGEDLEEQLTALKEIDLDSIASAALLAKLSKGKLLPKGAAAEGLKTDEARQAAKGVDEWPLLHGVWKEESLAKTWTVGSRAGDEQAASSPEKVKARLMSSKVLAEETAKAVEGLSRLVGKHGDATIAQVGTETSTSEVGKSTATTQLDTKAPKAAKSTAMATAAQDAEREWSGSEEDEDDDEEEDAEGAHASEGSSVQNESDDEGLDEAAIQEQIAQLGDLDQWDHLIGGSESEGGEDDEAADDDSDSEEEEAVATPTSAAAKKRKRSASPVVKRLKANKKIANDVKAPQPASNDDSASSEEDDEDDASDAESDASSSSSSSSRYLPTLSHGFVTHSLRTRDDDFSGGESDDDFEEDVEDNLPQGKGTKASAGQQKKNRMGQRARKALWEKKYGKNANHVKLREKERRKKEGGSEGRKGGYKPLRRGRNGQVLSDFVEPERKDSGWKRFPVAAADESAKPPPKAAAPAGREDVKGGPSRRTAAALRSSSSGEEQ
ncbi:BUD22-domain-containing protein [Jaminaea rosea]|uniref:BUD22-domain-containing protein n=1 Tax=Jaminaea rosea TaxID=1569628 RepID=A0A316US63_9BASI|nr:BUD22-domain-containing protein [Jaminaea rosea]PWN27161.1 BUD22-domain-containing protein [Jaminaea rosea]